jgi:hypothetical protein
VAKREAELACKTKGANGGPMTPNEVISRWRGECRHELTVTRDGMECSCGAGWEGQDYGNYALMHKDSFSTCPDYSTDPSAWDTALFDRIEEAGLWIAFTKQLYFIVWNASHCTLSHWRVIKSTPEQKSMALSRAIQEVEG